MYTRENAHVVTDLQTSCNKVAVKPISDVFALAEWLFSVFVTSSGGARGGMPPKIIFCPPPFCPSSKNLLVTESD
jgi:hypothetical protein